MRILFPSLAISTLILMALVLYPTLEHRWSLIGLLVPIMVSSYAGGLRVALLTGIAIATFDALALQRIAVSTQTLVSSIEVELPLLLATLIIGLLGEALQQARNRASRLSERCLEFERRERIGHAFLGRLAHELRNPLTPILTSAQLLSGKTPPPPDTIQWAANTIERQVRLMTGLIGQVLDLSRLMRGMLTLNLQQTTLNDIVMQAVEVSLTCQPPKDVKPKTRLPDRPVYVTADRSRLLHALTSLVRYARDRSSDRAPIEIELAAKPGHVSLSIQDHGPGLDTQTACSLFAPFSEPAINAPPSDRLGIELAIARGLIELHGATLKVVSQTDVQGVRFEIAFPVTPDGGTQAPNQP